MKQAMNNKDIQVSIMGVTEAEAKILQAVLLFLRNIRQHEVMEIKLTDDYQQRVNIHVKTNNRETFDL